MTEAVSKIILNDEAFNENTLKVSCHDDTGFFIDTINYYSLYL
jgi:hypothetical protein